MYRTLPCLMLILLACGNAPAQIDPAALPDDPVIRQWVLDVEEVYEAVLEIRYWISVRPDRWEKQASRVDELLGMTGDRLPEDDILHRHTLYQASWAYRDVAPDLAAEWRARSGLDPRGSFDAEQRRVSFGGDPNADSPRTPSPELPQQYLLRARRGEVGLYDKSFEDFSEPLPDLPRVQRALALYYPGPGIGCAWRRPVQGESDWRVITLRRTAEAFPDRLAATLTWMVDRRTYSLQKAIGNGGSSPNAVRLLEEVLAAAPDQLEGLKRGYGIDPSLKLARGLRPIRAYLQDGAPRVTPAIIIERLAGSEGQRLWALTWLQDFRVEPEPLDPIFAESLREVALTVRTDRERGLALRALRRLDPSEGDER